MSLPNQLSILRIILTPVFVILFFSDTLLIRYFSLLIFTAAVLTDWYDGYIARKYDYISEWGKFLDPLADKILVLTSLIVFNRLGYIPNWMVWVIVVRDVVITSLRLFSIKSNKPMKTIFLGKVKTCGQLILLYYIYLYHLLITSRKVDVQNNFLTTLLNPKIILFLLYSVIIITIISGIVYLYKNKCHLKKSAEGISRKFLPSESGEDI